MAELSAILKDPNYVNANDATKRAIFDKYSGQDSNFTAANEATQAAIRQKFGAAMALPKEAPAPQAKPTMADAYSSMTRAAQAQGEAGPQMLKDMARPALEMTGGLVGGAIGTGAGLLGGGPIGAAYGGVAGSALGYAGAKELIELADVYLGGKAPRRGAAIATEPLSNLVTGAEYEMGGQVAMKALAKGAGAIMDLPQLAKQKAAKLARNALGDDLQVALNELSKAKPGETAGQATADINSPVWQALLQRALNRDPRFLAALEKSQGEVSVNALARLAGGETATAARTATKEAKSQLNALLTPTLRTELEAANAAGEQLPKFTQQATQFGEAAAQKVQDVRRFTAAGERAAARAGDTATVTGMPRVPGRYTYMGELEGLAEKEAARAAEGSLRFGEAAKFSQAAADSLAAHGLKPLESNAVISKITAMTGNPKYAGNQDVLRSLGQVAEDMATWTNKGGVIDAWAIDSIRKNSVNAAISKLYPSMAANQQKTLAASVLAKIKPAIIDAVEEAGGTGYRQYLEDYASGMAKISEQKLSGRALEMWRSNKDAFVKLVDGNDPKTVEKILGAGKYDIAKELSDNTLATLQEEAKKAVREASISSQSSAGQDTLREVWMDHMSKIRIPSYLNTVRTTAEAALNVIEQRIGNSTMAKLTQAAKTAKDASALLNTLPAGERNKVLAIFNSPATWRLSGAAVAVPAEEIARGITEIPRNQLAPANQNALSQPQ
ncbi:hypothetical protein UFOVP920_27 [uncultured Caudovirales phage]|uniref:Uncharacterized protein n=1 Tax=uncultured Caudovirales phage TaxID=2100421 RepID=A0A6J5PP74_9CAUD|nr:hypothetical protein UFOVP920_27 [uncultured Caudovirales phage]CAB4200145.1 hypothetical protein UFOVP1345_27 [uncultured Caudovirales phage]CAB5228763.1 hypothetical protein UFOVP1542_27 [uncultured Caudovirales phage]